MENKEACSFADFFHHENVFIAISGLIGAGKTHLCKELNQKTGVKVLFEPVAENPYLEDFYNPDKREQTSFPMETFLLHTRYALQQEAIHGNCPVIMDRTLDDDVVFAKMLLDQKKITPRDFATYRLAYHNMLKTLKRPRLVVFLDCHAKIAKERIRQRDRPCEKDIPIGYLEDLQRNYEEWLMEMEKYCQVLRINWNQYQSTETVIRLIEEKLGQKVLSNLKKPL